MECEYYNRRCVRDTDTFTVNYTSDSDSNSGNTDTYAYPGNTKPDRDSGNTNPEPNDVTLRHGYYVLKPGGDYHQ